jgi:hypothetical protein
MSEEVPAWGARYVKREAPNKGRIVTVTRVWKDDAGCTAVAYEWQEKVGESFSACSLNVFHRTYRAEGVGGNARDQIMALAFRGTYEGKAQDVREAMDAYAHELAEKQRAWDGPSMTMAGRTMVPLGMLTDLIDPEASDGG